MLDLLRRRPVADGGGRHGVGGNLDPTLSVACRRPSDDGHRVICHRVSERPESMLVLRRYGLGLLIYKPTTDSVPKERPRGSNRRPESVLAAAWLPKGYFLKHGVNLGTKNNRARRARVGTHVGEKK